MKLLWRRRFPIPPADLRAQTRDPEAALRLAGGRAPLIQFRLESLRPYGLPIPVTDVGQNPFTRTIVEYMAGIGTEYSASALSWFYTHWVPRSLADLHGLDADEDSPLMSPASPACLPWRPGASQAGALRSRSEQESRMRGLLGPAPTGGHGFGAFGPVSVDAGERQFFKYVGLGDSVQRSGYQPERGGPIKVELLRSGADWRGRLVMGNHRCAVLAALGHEEVPVVVSRRTVRRSEVESWFGVRSGMYTVSQALEVFDGFFQGKLPKTFPQHLWE